MSQKGRPPIKHDNTAVRAFLWQYGEMGQPLAVAVPDWVECCVAGQRCYRNTRPSSTNAMLSALYQLDSIDYQTVVRFVNRKSVAIDNYTFSDSHCYSFFIRLRMASKAIAFHYERIYGKPIFAHIV